MADMNDLAGRARDITMAYAEVMLSGLEGATEQIKYATELARLQVRMEAFTSTLESIGAAKAPLLESMKKAKGPLKALLEQHVAQLEAQELSVLTRMGLGEDKARKVIQLADNREKKGELFERVGDKFIPVKE